ncbi:hypothetical protein Tco_0469167 [Tanacetum coccineum]
MFGSEPGEMALESSKAVVLPTFDMHIYTSELTSSKLKAAVEEYCIPLDLYPHLPHPDMTMNRLPSRDAARLSKVLVPLRPPPRHLLYVCGLTTACRHPEVRYDIKDQHNDVIDMDTLLKLPSWTGTVVSRGDPISDDQRPKPRVTHPLKAGAKIPDLTAFQKNLEKPNSKIAIAQERKEKQNLAKAEAKRSGTEANEGPKKKLRVQKHHVSIQSGSEGTLLVTPLHQAEPEVVQEPTPPVDATVAGSHVEKEVNLSGDTCVPTSSAATTQPSAHTEPPTAQKPATSKVNNRYVPNWRLRNDLRVYTFRACRELVSHLATPAEDEFLGGLSNVEVVSHAYQTLSQSVLAQGELLKRREKLSHNYMDLVHRNDANLEELDRLSAPSECPSRENKLLERLKDLERERDEWRVTASSQVERIRGLEKELEPRVQQLAVVEGKIKGLENKKLALSAKKITDSYDLPIDELLKVSPDVPSVTDKGNTSGVGTSEASQHLPPSAL